MILQSETPVRDSRLFQAVAHLQSLLSMGEVAFQSDRSDAALDMISALREGAPAARVLQAFCRVRQTCESVCYLALYRLRRWLEQEMTLRVGADAPQALDLSFSSLDRIEQNYRRHHWEWSGSNEAMRRIPVIFEWKQPVLASVATGAGDL